jgi:hypothetical protein
MNINGFEINPQSGNAGNNEISIGIISINEGIDKSVNIKGVCGDKSAPLHLIHEGLRQPFGLSGGGVFRIKNGGRFGVLKVGEPIVPPTPVETYTRLTYIECDGQQYINTGYVLSESDAIEAYYDCVVESGDKFLFFAGGSNGSTWLSCYSNSAYVRFGHTSSKAISNGVHNHYIKLEKGSVVLDVTTTALDFTSASTGPLQICGANSSSSGLYSLYKGKVMMIRVVDVDGNVKLELRPCKRDRDGKVGMLDIISGRFFASEGDADFIGGNEVRITEDYEIIDRVYFNKNKAFNTGYYGNNTTSINVMFQRTSTSAAAYLFGLTQGNRFTGYLSASSAYWRYGNANPSFSLATLKICKAAVTPGKTTIDATSRTFTVNEFTTMDPIPVGGYKSGVNPITKHYIGYIYYFRMWHGDTLLVDWQPCKRLSDGVEGFWDCVSQTFIEPMS